MSRLAARIALPSGSVPVGIGLVASGLTTYAFLALSGRVLGPERYASLSALWGLVFLIAGGAYVPFEQELGRAIAARIGAKEGTGAVIRRVAVALTAAAVLLLLITLAAGPVLTGRLFDDQWLLFLGCFSAFAFYPVSQLVKGTLAGYSEFRRYGAVLVGEGVVRLALCAGLAVVGVKSAGPYGLAVAAGPLFAFVFLPLVWSRTHDEGPPVRWGELSTALAYLCAGSLLSAVLLNAGPVAAKALAADHEKALVGRFLATLVMARVPLFLFQAVQVALLPKLARLHGAGQVAEFRAGLRKVLWLVLAVGGGGTLAVTAAGPTMITLLFGEDFVLGRGDIALLGLSTTAFLLDLVFAQALIATARYQRMALSWLIGAVVFLATLAVPFGLLLRVELALCLGGLAAAAAMAWFVMRLPDDASPDDAGAHKHRANPADAAPPPVLTEP